MQASVDPEAEYARRLSLREAARNQLEQSARRIGNARLLIGISAAILGFFVFGRVSIAPWWMAVPVVAFVLLAVWHSRVFARLERARRSAVFYEKALARVQGRWAGTGEAGERFRDPNHVYAEDLDVFGKGSLYELLCTARTRAGEESLARWLLAPAAESEVRERHGAITETRADIDLREEFYLLGEDFRSEFHPEVLDAWVEKPRVPFPPGTRIAAVLITAAMLVSFGLYMASELSRTPFLTFLLVNLAFGFALRSRVSEVTNAVESPARDLALASVMLRLIEQREFDAVWLQRLRQQLATGGLAASSQIARLEHLVDRMDWQHNLFFRPIAALLHWSTHLSVATENWRAEWGGQIRGWLDTIAQWEALSALAAYSFEHPADPFPELVEGPSCFDAEQLGHPLLPTSICVPNDVRLGSPLQLLIVSGSNMSGKSTLLRSVGLNTVIAWAGAPVRARRLRISPLQAGASIRVLDSLQDGRSRFYAEITRLRLILDLTSGPRTVLFLIDELLSGTNSHDRRIGAEAIVKALVERGASGIITTHDLALVHIADEVGTRARNLHFADELLDGTLHFDYRLHEGVVARSNALELMRSVGLPV